MNRILFVDDELSILNSLRRGLADEDYENFFASSGEEALRILEKEDISVLVTDMKMPGMTGLELLKQVKGIYPDLVKIVLSGYTHLPQVLVTVNQGDIFKFITKPWDLENEFKFVLREAIDFYNYKKELQRTRNALEIKNVSFQNILKAYDDKIIAVKEEIVLMRELNTLIFKEYNQLLRRWDQKSEHKDILLERFNFLQGLMLDVFVLVPFQNKRFAPKSIGEEMRRFIVDTESLKKIEMSLDSKTPLSLKGKYDLMIFLIKKSVTLFFVESFDTHIDMIISGTEISDKEILMRVILKSSSNQFESGVVQESAFVWLKELAARMGSELVKKEVVDGKAMILSMRFER